MSLLFPRSQGKARLVLLVTGFLVIATKAHGECRSSLKKPCSLAIELLLSLGHLLQDCREYTDALELSVTGNLLALGLWPRHPDFPSSWLFTTELGYLLHRGHTFSAALPYSPCEVTPVISDSQIWSQQAPEQPTWFARQCCERSHHSLPVARKNILTVQWPHLFCRFNRILSHSKTQQ